MNVVTGNVDILKKICRFYKKKLEIDSENASKFVCPNFRDVFPVVYHYFKNKTVPGHETFSVRLYFEWLRHFIFRVKCLPECFYLCNRQKTKENIVYELYIVSFDRRLKIVVKFQRDRTMLVSFDVVSTNFQR